VTGVVPAGARGGAVLAAVLALLTGCTPTAPAAPTLDDAVAERRAAIEAAERERFDAFVASSSARIAELGVPVPEFQGVVAREVWPDAVAACIDQTDPRIRADRVDDRLTVSYFGMVGELYDRSRWAIESCTAQFGVVESGAPTAAGPVELAWRFDDARTRLLPCLRGAGLAAPSLPSEAAFVAAEAAGSPWSPYALLEGDPAALQRALTLCPPSSRLLAEREARP
jgi:hypothetical protein